MSKRPKLNKKSKKDLLSLIKKIEEPTKKMVEKGKESGNEYMFYLSQMSNSKINHPELTGGLEKSDDTEMKDCLILASLIHHGANYIDILKVAGKFEITSGLMAAIEMLDFAVDSPE